MMHGVRLINPDAHFGAWAKSTVLGARPGCSDPPGSVVSRRRMGSLGHSFTGCDGARRNHNQLTTLFEN